MTLRSRWIAGGMALVAVIALVVLLIGSGSDDDAPDGSGTQAAVENAPAAADRGSSPTEVAPPAFDSPDEQAAAETVDEAYGGLRSAVKLGIVPLGGDVRSALANTEDVQGLTDFCELMSREAQDEVMDYVHRTAGFSDVDWTCEKAVALLIRQVKVSGRLNRAVRGKVVAMNIEGDRATATLSFGKDEPLGSVALVEEDGEWKLAAALGGAGR